MKGRHKTENADCDEEQPTADACAVKKNTTNERLIAARLVVVDPTLQSLFDAIGEAESAKSRIVD